MHIFFIQYTKYYAFRDRIVVHTHSHPNQNVNMKVEQRFGIKGKTQMEKL